MARKNPEDGGAAEESSARPDHGPTAWTLSIPAGPASTFAGRAEKAELKLTAPSEEGRAQITIAIASAIALVAVIQPNSDGDVSAELSGYANPGNTRGASGTLDGVSIKVRQV